jgi:hypothetical protein
MRPEFILRKKNKTKSHPLFRLVTEQCMGKKMENKFAKQDLQS